MTLDPQIPLAATQQPSFAQQAGQIFQLAGAIENQRNAQEQRQDQQAIQAYLKEGGNFNTPSGLSAAAEKLKGVVSPNAYQTLVQAHSEMKANEAKQEAAYAKMQPELIDGQIKQMDFIAQNLQSALGAYDTAKKEKGEQGALQDFDAAKTQIIQSISQQQMPGGKPLINPQMLQQFQNMNPAQVQSALMGTKYQQERLMNSLKLQKLEQDIKTSAALEGKYKREPASAASIPESISKSTLHGHEFLALLTPGEAADVLAVAEGRKALSDIPARSGQRGRIGQYVAQFDPGFSNIRNPADKAAAVAISKDISAIRPFIDMLDKNADIAVDLSKKVVATDNRLVNRSINWLRQNMGDNPDVAEFLAQTTFVQTEAARVLNNPRLVGQLTDTARQEMQHVLDGDMPLKSYERVIRRIQKDGANRFEAMEAQRDRLFAGSIKPKEVPQSDLVKPGESKGVSREAIPKGLPQGSKQIGHTPDGKLVWQSPDGKKYVE